MHYRRAATRSADVTLTYATRVYRAVVKDSAGWDVPKPKAGPRTRRHLVPSAQEPSGANRRRLGRRTRPKASGRSGDEHPTTSDPPEAGRCRRCNQRTMLLTKRKSEPFTCQKGRRSFPPQAGAPREKEKGGGGKEKRESGCLSPAPHTSKSFRSASKNQGPRHKKKFRPGLHLKKRTTGDILEPECDLIPVSPGIVSPRAVKNRYISANIP